MSNALSVSMDGSDGVGDDNDQPGFQLIYPLSVEFDRQNPVVHLQILEWGVLNPEHLSECRQTLRDNDLFLFKRTLSIPWKYHLYILINVREESYNVNFITVLLRQAFDVHRSVNRYSEKSVIRNNAYYRYEGSGKPDEAQASGSAGRKRSKPHEVNLNQKPRLSGYPDTGLTQQHNHNSPSPVAIKLQLVLRDIETSVTSLYDFSSLFGDRFDYERYQHSMATEQGGLSGDVPDHPHQSMTNEAHLQFKRMNNLYVCSFDNQRDFQVALAYLTDNAANWTDVYDIPVGLNDDCIRFSLDMFIRNIQFDQEVQLRRRRYELISGSALRSSARAPLSYLTVDERALFMSDEAATRIDEEPDAEVLLDYAFTTGFKCENTLASGRSAGSAEDSSKGAQDGHDQKKRIDIFSCFSTAHWSLYNHSHQLITHVDRDAFERLLIKSHAPFFRSLAVPFPRQRFDQLYETPLLFVPSLIWDIETIAAHPCTIPRGVYDDESVVSIALVMERPAMDARRLSMLWLLVPDCLDRKERDSIVNQSLLRIDNEYNLHASPTVICYTDERAMLYDFCALMRINFPILHSYMGILSSHLSAYDDLCTFLIGHNSVGYDYAFILNRCLFFGFDEMSSHLTRKMAGTPGTSHEISALYTFNDAQICIDTMLFLRARMPHLTAFDLRSVLRFYQCDIAKLDLDAVQIRHFYHTLSRLSGDNTQEMASQPLTATHYAAAHADSRLKYFAALLRYNVFDCLSLCDLLGKLSFVQYLTTLMRCFSVPLESAIYRGNSRLLPSILINDCLSEKREFLVSTHENSSIFSVDRCGVALIDDFRSWLNQRSALPPATLAMSFEYQPLLDCCTASIPSYYLHHVYNPYIEFVEYMRTICWTNTINEMDERDPNAAPPPPTQSVTPAFHPVTDWPLNADQFYSFKQWSLPCDRQMDLLRIGEKTYVGGMNYADPCHIKHPILMDYHSFYPSIIRHYQLDVNNVAIFTVKKLLLSIRPMILLEEMITCQVLRLFDYTALQDVDIYVNRIVFTSPHFHHIFTPKRYSRREWHEGIEIDSLDLLLASSKSLERRVLVLIKKMDESVIDRVVTQALLRRAEWKKKKRENPDDKIIQSRELMDKLLANGTYGYLNYCNSVTFSRPTAAAVTLLCRHAFSRTRFIIESDALLRGLDLDPQECRAQVIYIDTDGCIVFMQQKSPAASGGYPLPITPLFNVTTPPSTGQGLCLSTPPFGLSAGFDAHSVNANPLSLIHRNKERFVAQVNALLNMQYVTLAAEHHEAMAASVFATKKYSLYEVDALSPPQYRVKKTGFESNAPLPVKMLYDLVLRNVALLNHGYDLVHADRFICKIVRHRAFFYAMFDKLYQWWQAALKAHRDHIRQEREHFCHHAHDGNNTPPSANDDRPCPGKTFNLVDFASRIPLNPKETKGKMAEFIDRVLRECKYDIGDRVRVLKLAPVDPKNNIVLDTQDGQYLLYDLTATRFELFDIAQEDLDHVLPDFKYFMGGHASYLYQCIEGCQTLRDRSTSQREPVEWATMAAFYCHLRTMKASGYVSAASDINTSLRAEAGGENEKNTLYLRSFNAICDLHYATWLWRRLLSKRIDPSLHSRVLLLWNSHAKTDIKKIMHEARTGKLPLHSGMPASVTSKDIPCAPPKMLGSAFFEKWFTRDGEACDRLIFDALFKEPDKIASTEDSALKMRLIRSGALLYKPLS